MKKINTKHILAVLTVLLVALTVSSCSSWRKTKCGECPRWTYNTTLQDNDTKA
ncbi:MAG: hypothetical protein J6P44_03460 [Bacteroidales bacterium]|nr:hypothetical protein [Bacteroidales bacterium]